MNGAALPKPAAASDPAALVLRYLGEMAANDRHSDFSPAAPHSLVRALNTQVRSRGGANGLARRHVLRYFGVGLSPQPLTDPM
jgi:hypothetical protein